MTLFDWFLCMMLASIYILRIFTVAMMTFQEGRVVLGILGIFLPLLWLIEAIRPAKPGSRDETSQGRILAARMQEWTG